MARSDALSEAQFEYIETLCERRGGGIHVALGEAARQGIIPAVPHIHSLNKGEASDFISWLKGEEE